MGKGKGKLKQPLLKNNSSISGSSKQAERRLKELLKKQAHRAKNYACQEEVSFALQLEQDHWSIRHVDGDGNCMFRSLSDQLYGSDERYAAIRAAVVAYMKREAEHFSCFMEDDEPFDQYIKDMKEDGTWGGNHELFAASQVYSITIHVHQYNAATLVFEHNKPSKVVHLSYHGEHHYNSLHATQNNTSRNQPISNKDNMNSSNVAAVAQAVPWCSLDAIHAAVEKTTSTADAIELLMTTAHPLEKTSNNTTVLEKELSAVAVVDSDCDVLDVSVRKDVSQKPLSKKEMRRLKRGKLVNSEKSDSRSNNNRSNVQPGATIRV